MHEVALRIDTRNGRIKMAALGCPPVDRRLRPGPTVQPKGTAGRADTLESVAEV